MVHNPYQRFSAAACGDAGALRRLVDDCAATARREGDWSALVEATLTDCDKLTANFGGSAFVGTIPSGSAIYG